MAGVVASALGALPRADAQCEPRWLGDQGRNIESGWALAMWDPDGPGPKTAQPVAGGTFVAVLDGPGMTKLGGDSNGKVLSLAATKKKSELYAGGTFTSIGGQAASFIARWDGVAWKPLGTGVNGNVQAMIEDEDGSLIVGGLFTAAGGTPAYGLARWDGSGWTSFNLPVSSRVSALAFHPDGHLHAGGDFSNAGENFGMLRREGGLWIPYAPGCPGSPNAVDFESNGSMIIGGSFKESTGGPGNYIARWNGSAWEQLGAGRSGVVKAVHVMRDGQIVTAGSGRSGGTSEADVARWDGTKWRPMVEGPYDPNAGTCLLERPDGSLIVGGITTAGSILTNGLAIWRESGWSALGISTIFTPTCTLRTSENAVLIGGLRSGSSCVYRFDGAELTALGGPFIGDIYSLSELPNGQIVAGGAFSRLEGKNNSTAVAVWDGHTWAALQPKITGVVSAVLALPDGSVLAAGKVDVGLNKVFKILRWDGTAWSDIGPAGVTGTVNCLYRQPDGSVVAGGPLGRAGDAFVSTWIWDGATWTSVVSDYSLLYATSFANDLSGRLIATGKLGSFGDNPIAFARRDAGWEWIGPLPQYTTSWGDPLNSIVRRANGRITVGGRFSIVLPGEVLPLSNFASFDGTQWSRMGGSRPFVPSAMVALPQGELVAAGSENTSVTRTVRWTDNNAPWVAQPVKTKSTNKGSTLVLRAMPASGYENVAFQWRRNGVDLVDGPGGASAEGGIVAGAAGTMESPTAAYASVLTITGAQTSDTGEYSVVFFNACGGSTSTAAVVVKGCLSDLNGDDVTDDADYLLFAAAYDVMVCADAGMSEGCPADLNGDGVVDDADFSLFVVGYARMGCE